MSQVLKNVRVIESKRQQKNLRRILCPSNFRHARTHAVKKCPDQRCGTCPLLKEGSVFNIGNRNFIVKSNMTCATKNVIYCITCEGCGQHYIGETGSTLRTRIRIHRQHIRQPEYRQIKLSEHLYICGNGQFTVFPIYINFLQTTCWKGEKKKNIL